MEVEYTVRGKTDMRYTVAEIKEIVSALAAQYGADRIYLFGSYARGDADKDSDIDLRIDKGAIRGLQLGGLAADLEDALGIPVDLIPTGSLDSKFLNSISDDEVLLYEASWAEYQHFRAHSYDTVAQEITWEILPEGIPNLKTYCGQIIAESKN